LALVSTLWRDVNDAFLAEIGTGGTRDARVRIADDKLLDGLGGAEIKDNGPTDSDGEATGSVRSARRGRSGGCGKLADVVTGALDEDLNLRDDD
jgi:hypothetical protein